MPFVPVPRKKAPFGPFKPSAPFIGHRQTQMTFMKIIVQIIRAVSPEPLLLANAMIG